MRQHHCIFFSLLAVLGLACSSCHTSAPRLDYRMLAKASLRLGTDIRLEDNHALYLEAADWIGTPYRSGGDSKKGTDCSGMVCQIYRKVYRRQVPRNTAQLQKQSHKVPRRSLKEGDLVFFGSPRSGKKVAHVGIYLKEGKFIHASTGRGVIVSRLSEEYYARHWLGGGRMQ